MQFSSVPRWIATGAFVFAAVAFAAIPGQAQVRQQMMDKVAVQAGNEFVTKINGQNCTDFKSTLSQMKQGSNAGSMSAKLKANPEARGKYVNIVGGPLLNKMINCDMLPGM
ncbi:MAG TPA: hypothetical protein VGK84_09595 [Candidatus Tumulicola sp.]|jgi:hypothetical protein